MALKRFSQENSPHQALYEDLYDVKFYNSDGREFIEQLHQHCAAASMLRKADTDAIKVSFDREAQVLINAIKDSQYEDCILLIQELTEKYLPNAQEDEPDFMNSQTLMISNYRSARKKHIKGSYDKDDMKKAEVKFIEFMQLQLDELKSLVYEQ